MVSLFNSISIKKKLNVLNDIESNDIGLIDFNVEYEISFAYARII